MASQSNGLLSQVGICKKPGCTGSTQKEHGELATVEMPAPAVATFVCSSILVLHVPPL